MLIYIFIISIVLFGELVDNKRSKYYFIFTIVVSTLFFCFGYMTGSDWRQYEPMYNLIGEGRGIGIFVEPGFYAYMVLFNYLKINFWGFLIFTKIVSFLVFIFFIKKYSPENKYFVLAYFLVSFGLFYYIDNPLRNLIAATIYLFSIHYILEGNFLKYLLIVLLAATFHVSVLITIPFYFILNIDLKKAHWILIFLLVIIASIILRAKLMGWLTGLLGTNPYIGSKITFYFSSMNGVESHFFSLGTIIKFIFFILILISKDYFFKAGKIGKMLFNGSMLFLLFNRLGASIIVLSRFQMYTAIFFCIAIIFMIKNIESSSRKTYLLFLVVIIYATLIMTITTTYKYIPYTNYLFYLNKNVPFYQRANYNYVKSPYYERK